MPGGQGILRGHTLPLVSGILAAFLAANLYLMSRDIYLLNLLPIVIFLVILAFRSLDTLLLVTVFLVPLSVPLEYLVEGLGHDLSLPSEPLLIGIMVIFLLKLILEKEMDRKFLRHPLTLVILIQLGWMLITSLTGSMPVVSLKAFLARSWFLAAFYFLASRLFLKPGNMERFLWAYIIPFSMVILYTLYRHSQYGLVNQMASHSAVHPFYNDHTAYGAALAMFLPWLFLLLLNRACRGWKMIIVAAVAALFLFAMVFSYTRAAWLSLAGALGVFILIRLRIRLATLAVITGIALVYLYSFRTEIIMKMEANKQTSSREFTEHIQSITNITSDASNAERINRWKAALRMFRERPLLGWGPGTYQFRYAPFQFYREKTYISTDFGDLGNAHSEYISPLSESGLPGLLIMLVLTGVAVFTGLRVHRKLRDRKLKILALGVFLGLTTYFLHGLLNNFLHTDKAAAPFWGFLAILVVLDLYPLPDTGAGEGSKNTEQS